MLKNMLIACLLVMLLGIGCLAHKDNAVNLIVLDGDKYQVEWLHHEKWDETWAERWAFEGNATVKVQEGKLLVEGLDPGNPNATIWYRKDLPKNLVIRFKAQVLPPEAHNAANINVFLGARETDGCSLKFKRSGAYDEYHKIPNYIITLTGGDQPGWSRVRRDPGFNLIHEAKVRSEVGKEYGIVVTLLDGRIRYYINGQKWHDVTDSKPLCGGKFALRTWKTNMRWDNVEIGKLIEQTNGGK